MKRGTGTGNLFTATWDTAGNFCSGGDLYAGMINDDTIGDVICVNRALNKTEYRLGNVSALGFDAPVEVKETDGSPFCQKTNDVFFLANVYGTDAEEPLCFRPSFGSTVVRGESY